MKKILILIFILIPTLIYGQRNKKQEKIKKRQNEFIINQIEDVL